MQVETILSAQNVSKRYGDQQVLDDVSLSIHDGDRVGLIGRNGSGKSTLLRILAETIAPDAGIVTRRQGLRVGFLQQQTALDPSLTVGQALDSAVRDIAALQEEHEQLSAQLEEASPGERQRLHTRLSEIQHDLEKTGAWNLHERRKRLTIALNLPAPDRILDTLSGGELRRLDLAVTLFPQPGVILLDEPTNHIDTDSVEWIESFLESYDGSCVLVTHDRYFLDRVVTRIVELERSRIYSFPGNYEEFLEYKTRLQEIAARTEKNRQNTLERELEWLRRAPKARGTKQKARKQRAQELDAREAPPPPPDFTFEVPQPRRLGKRILEARDIGFQFGEHVLFKDLSFDLQKGTRAGIIGPNGSGKTTLLRVLMGEEENHTGKIHRGDSVDFLYVDQKHEDVDPKEPVLKFVSGGAHYLNVDGRRVFLPAYLEKFLFDMDAAKTPMGSLSGGERNRVELAKTLLRGGNVLVLDEPTNDLDLDTLRVLEETILDFDGCALIVSHDRYFLNRVCTHLFVFEGAGNVIQITGNYDDYLLHKQRVAAEQKHATQPAASEKSSSRTSHPDRLTYLEKQQLKTIESEIEEAERRLEALEEKVNQPGFYEQPYESVRETLDALEEAKARVEERYATWENLESRAHLK